jgi:hypothetical protein
MQQTTAVLIQFAPILILSLLFGPISRALAKDKGRNVTLWTILGFIPIAGWFMMPFFIGAANLRLEMKIDAMMKRLDHNL